MTTRSLDCGPCGEAAEGNLAAPRLPAVGAASGPRALWRFCACTGITQDGFILSKVPQSKIMIQSIEFLTFPASKLMMCKLIQQLAGASGLLLASKVMRTAYKSLGGQALQNLKGSSEPLTVESEPGRLHPALPAPQILRTNSRDKWLSVAPSLLLYVA